MTTKFLDGASVTTEIRRLVEVSTNVRMAVAFWGKGAAQELGLVKKGAAATIICNLISGGTNPNEIEAIKKKGVNVRQCDNIHGKVYIFDDRVILGSSNASANGLALQGRELSGWHEANVLIDDPTFYASVSSWYHQLPHREIEDDDLQKAQDAYKRRRAAVLDHWDGENLIDALRQNTDKFRLKNIYICAYTEDLDSKGRALVRQEQKTRPEVGGFGWDVGRDATLVCFSMYSGNIKFDGFWKTRDYKDTAKRSGTQVWFAESVPEVNGIRKPGPISSWRPALKEWSQQDDIAKKTAEQIEIGDFADKYLNKAA